MPCHAQHLPPGLHRILNPTELKRLTDQCVMCGMCLPHCPTYHLTRDEAESPRGRVSLIQGMSSGRLPYSPTLAAHLDHCLACRACEAVCPSGVQYGEIIAGGRALLAEHRPPLPRWPRRLARWGGALITDRRRLYRLGRTLRLAQRSGLPTLARRIGLRGSLARLEALLPPLPRITPWRDFYRAQGEARGKVALFIGCVSDLAERAVLQTAVQLLNRVGYGVHVPAAQTCCGALHLHRGDRESAETLARRNVAAFQQRGLDAIVTVSSGCGATLGDYVRSGHALGAPVRDVSDFLDSITRPASLAFAPLPKNVAVHDPCTLTHVLRKDKAPYALLARIPEIELVALSDNRRCCGAAGSYMLTEPATAAALRAEKIAALAALQPDILVTSNIGCALHLRAGLAAAGLNIEVLHPIELLARQLRGG